MSYVVRIQVIDAETGKILSSDEEALAITAPDNFTETQSDVINTSHVVTEPEGRSFVLAMRTERIIIPLNLDTVEHPPPTQHMKLITGPDTLPCEHGCEVPEGVVLTEVPRPRHARNDLLACPDCDRAWMVVAQPDPPTVESPHDL